ncbi:hypothetical protein D3C78_1458420 [compost metagenome]
MSFQLGDIKYRINQVNILRCRMHGLLCIGVAPTININNNSIVATNFSKPIHDRITNDINFCLFPSSTGYFKLILSRLYSRNYQRISSVWSPFKREFLISRIPVIEVSGQVQIIK